MNSKMSWILALVFIVIIKTSHSLEFCDSFAENEYKISYPYRQIKPNNQSESYIFIKQHYWPLIYTDHTDDNQKKVKLMAADGKLSNWFGDKYMMAFCVWSVDKCKAGAVRTDRKVIEWIDLDQSLNKTTPIPTPKKLKFMNKDVKFAYVPTHKQMSGEIVIFVSPDNSEKDKRYEFHRVNTSAHLNTTSMTRDDFYKFWTNKNDVWEVDPYVFEREDVFENLTGVLSQFSAEEYNKRTKGGEKERLGQGLILLFKDDKSIKYCFTFIRFSDGRCRGSEMKLLIDCSRHEIKTTTIASQRTSETPITQTVAKRTGLGLGLTIILMIIVILFIIVIALIVWFVITRMRKSSLEGNPTFDTPLSVPRLQTTRTDLKSKVKSNVKTSKPMA